MESKHINTSIGVIAFKINEIEGSVPVIFLNGVYYDHNMWNYQVERITDRTVITIDMPFQAATAKIKLPFKMQHLMIGFRKFYSKQVAKALYGKETYSANHASLNILESSMYRLKRKKIIQTAERFNHVHQTAVSA